MIEAMIARFEDDNEEAWPHTPQQWIVCDWCHGSGVIPFGITVLEIGCGYSHDEDAEKRCDRCVGWGGWVDEAEHDEM